MKTARTHPEKSRQNASIANGFKPSVHVRVSGVVARHEWLARKTTVAQLSLVHFLFDIRKAIAATAYVCELNGGSLNILHLVKTLYVADREALLNWHRTITGDKFCSMKNGPILSRVYDLMRGRILGPEMDAWNQVFNPRDGNMISIKGKAETGPLSKREKDLLKTTFEKFKDLSPGALIEFLHRILPEWKDPGASSEVINPTQLFFEKGFCEDEVAEIEHELESVQSAKVALQAN